MAMKPETKFAQRAITDLNKLPNTWAKKFQEVGRRGIPDIIGCIRGLFFAIELKRDGKCKPDALQTYNLTQIAEKAQGLSFVAYPGNWGQVYGALASLAIQEKSPTHPVYSKPLYPRE